MPIDLPPPPPSNSVLDRWLNLLWRKFTAAGELAWSLIDKTGSNLTDIETRNHNDLQSFDGGTAGEYYHLTSVEYTGTGTGVFVRQDSPSITGSGTSPALKITQTGAGHALLVEDSASTDSTPFVIDADGKVIIGNTATDGALARFQIYGTDNPTSQIRGVSASSTAGQGFNLFCLRARGSPSTYSAVQASDVAGKIFFYGHDGTAFLNLANIEAIVDGTPGTNDMPGRMEFSTTADGASSPTIRMTIKNNGNVLIGTTTDDAANKLQVNGGVRITQTGSGNALTIEDEASTDSTPVIVNADGRVVVGHTAAVTTRVISTTLTPRLQVHSAGSGADLAGFAWVNTATPVGIVGSKSRSGTIGTVGTVVNNNDSLLRIAACGDDGTLFTEAGRIEFQVDGTPGTNDMPGRLVFYTTPDGSNAPTEAMRINSSQRVLIGTTTDDGSTRLQVNGTIKTAGYTVATLPTGVVGQRAYVTDATAPTFLGTLTGGGSVTCPVFYNGSAWVSG